MILTSILFCFLLLLGSSLNQDAGSQQVHKEMKLDVQENGSLLTKDGLYFYKLVIPANITLNSYDMMIRVKENDLADEGSDDFSDADLYVSKVTKVNLFFYFYKILIFAPFLILNIPNNKNYKCSYIFPYPFPLRQINTLQTPKMPDGTQNVTERT
jgi:hypothetical protein